ncbi:hypothetical protein HY494_00330 [Candidatus Woesearchaeota archaeon]|nr:hypothetical protein [Candidatus Woesearchaeota archaeon]
MVYNQDAVRYAFSVAEKLGIPQEETSLAIAQLEGHEKELLAFMAERKKGNGYRRDGKSLEDALHEICTRKEDLVSYNRTPRVYSVDDDFLAVEYLQCVDADGNVFEQHDNLYVRKDIERDEAGKQINFTPYRAIVHFESKGMSLLSFAGTYNLVAALYQNRDNPEVKPVLMQYKNKGNGDGWHAQNTVIDWGEQKIIHHPHQNDFTKHGGKTEINQAHQRILLPFIRKEERKILWDRSLSHTTLEKGLKDPLMARFVRQLTGLQDPSTLVEIGSYFGKTVQVWISSSNETRAAWFGCSSVNLDLLGNCLLITTAPLVGYVVVRRRRIA